MSNETSAQGLRRIWHSIAQPGDTNFFNSVRMCQDVLNKMKNILLSAYAVVQNAIRRIIYRAPSPGTSTPDDSFDLESQPAVNNQATDTNQGLESTLGTAIRNHNNPFTSEADDLEEGSQLAAVTDQSFTEAPLSRATCTWMWVMVLIVLILFLIALPGVVLGLVTRKIALGLAISGAVAPAVVFFGGLYYHHNK